MSEITNVIQIKRGAIVPPQGGLAPYELGFVVNKVQNENKVEENQDPSSGYLYIGDLSGIDEAGQLIYMPQKIKAGYADQAGNAVTANSAISATSAKNAEEAENANNARNVKIEGIEGIIPITKGGTGAANESEARANLGLGATAVMNTIPIANGGTGAQNAKDARANLGIPAMSFTDTNTKGFNNYGMLLSRLGNTTGESAESDNYYIWIDAVGGLHYGVTFKGGTTPTIFNVFSTGQEIILNEKHYGDTLPAPGKKGRLFLKKVSTT